MDEESKKQIEEMTKSQYFDYLTEKRVRIKVGEVVSKYWHWAIVINGVVLVLFGVSIIRAFWSASEYSDLVKEAESTFTSSTRRINSATEEAKSLVDSIQGSIGIMKEQAALFDSLSGFRNDIREKLISQQENLNEQAKKALEGRIETMNALDIAGKLSQFSETRSKMETLKDELTKSHNTMDSTVHSIGNLDNAIKAAASVTQLFVERGDKKPGGGEFRAARVNLPYSEDQIEARFHDCILQPGLKRVLVDIYGNDRLLFEDLFLTDSKDPAQRTEVQFCSSDGRLYDIKPLFIYMPPNFLLSNLIPGYGRIPDFVILEIRLLDMKCPDVELKTITKS